RELLLVCEWSEEKIELMDVVSPRPVLWQDIVECLAACPGQEAALNGRCKVELHFTPDFADLAEDAVRCREDGKEFFFVKGEAYPLPQGYVIPISART
ncbi:MAG: hypothetical protein K0Q90_3872, partial [Paenibacillaceae bacterium]|nr:hypothetical protein [Paenibacillaceae bacterium]